jgi:TPR repeat protein
MAATSEAAERGASMLTTLRRLLLVGAGTIALSASGLAQVSTDLQKTLSQADAAYERADYAEAVRWYRLAADQGDAWAQYNLGLMYANGRGVPQNDAEAIRWYRLAADQGYAWAQFNLGNKYAKGQGVPQNDAEAARWYRLAADQGYADAQSDLGNMYANGEGVPQNDVEAVRWFRLAADQGNAVAQYNLGIAFGNGRGVPQNYAEAVRWYRLAADQGYASAQSNLGLMYANGRGVPQNDAEAVRWYRLAAGQGYALAQFNLGLRYANGRGVPQNDIEAYKWWSLAAAQGDSDAAKNRDIVRDAMAPAQIAEAQRLAAAWKPNAAAVAEPSAAPNKAVVASAVESTGSGFFLTVAGHLLTNAHVVEGCSRVSLAGGSALTVLDIDASSDLALLKAGGTSTRTPLMLRQGRGVRLADSVVVAGFPLTGLLSSGLNVTTGTVSALAGPGDDHRLIQITAPVQPGNSGGPLLDTSGNVVGVVVSKLDAVKVASITGDIPQNVNFAISLGTLQAFLDSNSIDYQTRASASPKSNADVAEMARAATVQIECRN